MKRGLVVAAGVAVLGVLAVWMWRRSATGGGEEAQVETEVAVRIGHVTRATLRAYVTAYGVVEPEPPGVRPAGSARITPAVAGIVAAVTCAEGQRVEKGAVLFQLDSRLADAAAEKARGALTLAEANLERQRTLIAVDGTSRKAVAEAEQAASSAQSELAAAQTQQALLRVKSPLAGTVARIEVKAGETVDLTSTMAEVVDASRLVVTAQVPSAELGVVRVGQRFEPNAVGSEARFEGTVSFVSPQVDPKTGTALVRGAVSRHSGLRPGELVAMRIVVVEHADRLAVPVEGVVKDRDGVTVIAVVDGNKARQRPVVAGLRDGGLVEVEAEGLQVGQTVVAEGSYALPKETKIRVLNP